MRMILGVDNKYIEDELTKKYISKYHIYVVKTKDVILAMINKEEETTLVLRYDLQGEVDVLSLLDSLKSIKKLTTIMIVKNLDNSIKEILYSREIFNIVEGKKLKIDDLIFVIDNPKVLNIEKVENSIKSNVIFVLGDSGSGKTLVSKILANNILEDSSSKVLVIDMDYINPSLDLYVEGAKNYSLIDYIKDVINSCVKDVRNYETIDKRYSNIRYILNQKSIGIPNDEITLQLFQLLKDNYDYIIVDTSSYMIDKMYDLAVKLNSNIIYIIEPNIKLLKNINKKILNNSNVILNRYREDKDISKYIKESNEFQIDENIRRLNNISKKVTIGKINIRLRKIENKIGIVHYTQFQKIIKKIVFKEELK